MKIICPNPQDFSKEILLKLKKNFTCDFKKVTQKKLDQKLFYYDAVLTRFNHKINYYSPNKLNYIISPTTGVDHIDTRYFKSKTKVLSLLGEKKFLKKINASSEFTIYLILKALKTFKIHDKRFYNEIHGKKIGIVGYGRIGKKIFPILEKMGAKVFINDIKKKIVPNNKYKSINWLLKNSEILSFNIPLNSKTKCFMDKKKISLIKPNSIIINTSRGDIFNEKNLIDKIKNGNIYYATDVLGNFFLKNIKDITIKNRIIYTKHVAGLTIESVKMTDNFVLKKFFKCIKRI